MKKINLILAAFLAFVFCATCVQATELAVVSAAQGTRDAAAKASGVNKTAWSWDSKVCDPFRKLTDSPPGEVKEIPVYPDVWDFVPDPARGEEIRRMVLLPDGDVGLGFYSQKEDKWRFQRLFFNRPLSEEDQCRIEGNVGTANTRAKFPDGRIIWSMGSAGWRSNGCYDGLEGQVVMYADESQKKILTHKTFLYILDKPRHWKPKPNCYEGPAFDYRIVSLSQLDLLPLPDGTFLVADLYGIYSGVAQFIVRFDGSFQSKSRFLNDKLFVVNGVQTGAGEYGERANGDFNLSRLHRDLYRRLMNIKEGKQ
jgi:hypothetical protein